MATENKEASQSENFKNAVCYIPLVAFVLFFTETTKTPALKKHIKYGAVLFLTYIVLNFLMGLVFLGGFRGIVFLIYIALSGFLIYKAYKGQDIKIDYIDTLEKKVGENLK